MATALQVETLAHVDARNPFVMYLAKVRPVSRRAVTTRLRLLARLAGYPNTSRLDAFPWSELQPAHVAELSTRTAARYAPDTARAVVVALRGILRACWHCGAYGWEEYERRADAITRPAGERLPKGRALTPEECGALFKIASPRDRAVLALLFGAGLRRAEAAAIGWESFDGEALRFAGKGDRERVVPLPGWACEALRAIRPTNGAGRILRGRKGRHAPEGDTLTAEGVRHIVIALASRAGVSTFTPHDARRTWISELLDVADTAVVATLAGHQSTEQTRRYDRRGERAGRDAVGKLRPMGGS